MDSTADAAMLEALEPASAGNDGAPLDEVNPIVECKRRADDLATMAVRRIKFDLGLGIGECCGR